MEDLKVALNNHADLVSELFEKLSAELRSGFRPAVDDFVGFFHAIDWKVNTLFTLCHLIVKWKKAELRHRARLARDKQE
ncbi:Transmembrane protein 18 [Cocos nucifera]|uniref:Transmembrane protein 18 n=1 Tax=Cocos nucifera TaxID=13894 RepID=A0A8K0HXC8_COCNU|nr:Transmembrane protein 18 [Cocos nucifera]